MKPHFHRSESKADQPLEPIQSSETFVLITVYQDHRGVARLLSALCNQTRMPHSVMIVDNSPKRQEFFSSEDFLMCSAAFRSVTVVSAPENSGVSGALVLGIEQAKKNGCTFLWLFDQDSVPDPECCHLLSSFLLDHQDFAASCCQPVLVPSKKGLPGMIFRRFRLIDAPDLDLNTQEEVVECDATISSGSLFRLEALTESRQNQLEPIVELGYFIDAVDFDMCLKLRSRGYKIAILASAQMEHTLGTAQAVGLPLPQYGPLRLYTICRNHTHMELRHSKGVWKVPCVFWRVKYLIWICWRTFNEGPGWSKRISACILGTWDGLLGKLGKPEKYLRGKP